MDKLFTVRLKKGATADKGFMKVLDVQEGVEYLVLGIVHDKLLLKVESNLVEIYPRHTSFGRFVDPVSASDW